MADSLKIKVETEVLRVPDTAKTLTAAKELAVDFLAAHPEIDQQQLWDRITFLLGSIDPWQREGTNSVTANKSLVVSATDAAPFFMVTTASEEEAGQAA
jgi:hypothetical protein